MSEKYKTIEDFLVRLVDTGDGGKHIELASEANGRLAGFPAWDHADRDLKHFIRGDIPLGTREEPFEDRDQGWRIAVFEHGGWVYVAEGSEEGNSAFRVRTGEYLLAWQELIDQFNPALELNDLFDEPV
jgi:hypothetical protein